MWLVELMLVCLVCSGHGRNTHIRSKHMREAPTALESLTSLLFGVNQLAVGWQASAPYPLSLAISRHEQPRHAVSEMVAIKKKDLHRGGLTKKQVSAKKLAKLTSVGEDESTPMMTLDDFPDFSGPGALTREAWKVKQAMPPNRQKHPNAKVKAQKQATQVIETFYSHISKTLKQQLKNFRMVMRALPPFQAELSRLTWDASVRDGGHTMHHIEDQVDLLRRSVIRVGKEATARASKATDVKEAKAITDEAIELVKKTVEDNKQAHFEFLNMVQRLRRLPRPVHGDPMLVLVGMPNVGKSSLVSATSTGNPEINDYPFTTRRLKMGHVIGATGARYQVMDTPGMLARLEEERNPMEGLTLAAVEHLPSSVIFVMDMSGLSGAQSSPLLQLRVRDQVRALYPSRPWLDVRTKADLPLDKDVDPSMIPAGTLEVSAEDGTNLETLKERMAQLVGGDIEGYSG